MVESVAVTGMVIGTFPINEYDRRVVILTKERGKITAFARGARRQYSAMLASTQLFAFGTFRVIEGRNAYTLLSAEITNYFEDIAKEPMKACYASYFLEMAGYYARENNNEIELLKLLYQTLRILCKGSVAQPLIRVIYELRIFVVNGEYPECFRCVICGEEKELKHFSSGRSGMVCNRCLAEAGSVLPVDASTLYAAQYIITSSIEKLYTFNVSAEVLYQLRKIMEHYIRDHIDKTFKSLEILDIMGSPDTF
ncbi:MAG: DNA repair protein RecO [Clostridia bacterium]|nr:DNA repair protein RecO [Lachnospiraceae bacterium]NCB99218.1 DNA repair protein RecO [Clostridia bacterium]NCD04159.1 DNA repair protein RecO [Clostridia bacterium]